MTYTHVVKGFLHAARPLSPATIELCIDLAVKLSSVKVCFAKHFIDISVQLFRISFWFLQDPLLLEYLEALLEKKVIIDDKRMNQLLRVTLSLEDVNESDFYSRKIGKWK